MRYVAGRCSLLAGGPAAAGASCPVPPVAHPFVECVRACVTRTISVSPPSLPQSSRLISHKMRPDLLPLQICCHRRRRRRRPPSYPPFLILRSHPKEGWKELKRERSQG